MSDEIKTGGGKEKAYRMSDKPLVDNNNEKLPNTSGNIVKFKVEYPKDHKGPKIIKGHPYYGLVDGSVHELHVLHAQSLEEKNLGKIVK